MDTNNTNGFPVAAEHRPWALHPQDKVDWRKRLLSVSRYINELEMCLEETRCVIVAQRRQIEAFTAGRKGGDHA